MGLCVRFCCVGQSSMGLWGGVLQRVGLWGHGMSGTVPFGAAVLGAVGGAVVGVWGLWCGAVGCWGCAIRKKYKKPKVNF